MPLGDLIKIIRKNIRQEQHNFTPCPMPSNYNRVEFTTDMKDYTVLVPQLSPIHFNVLAPAMRHMGLNIEILPDATKEVIDTGLKYVNNDACYPSLIVVGQMMHAITSGKYDINKLALIMTQTGGGCRATNYVGFIRRALAKAGYPQIPAGILQFVQFGFHKSRRLTGSHIHQSQATFPGLIHERSDIAM